MVVLFNTVFSDLKIIGLALITVLALKITADIYCQRGKAPSPVAYVYL